MGFLLRLSLCLLLWVVSVSCHAQSAPVIRATSAIVIDADTGETLWEKNPDLRLPPASTTKIVTALLQLEYLPNTASITVPKAATGLPGIRIPLKPGEVYRGEDLLNAQLLESANDASAAVALTISKNLPTFVGRMNELVASLGATNSHFTNPHGLDDPDHYSSARDLALIARYGLGKYPEFASAVRKLEVLIPANVTHPAHKLKNRNDLLRRFPKEVDGVKTGWTSHAGYCFVGSGKRGNRHLITVVLHSSDWVGETLALLDYGFRQKLSGVQKPPTPAPEGIVASKVEPPHFLLWKVGIGSALLLPVLLFPFVKSKIKHKMTHIPDQPEFQAEATPPQTHSAQPSVAASSLPGCGAVPLSIARISTSDWLKHWLQEETRLADPALRALAREAVAQNPDPFAEALAPLLDSPKPLTRFAVADLVASFSPSHAEETLICLLDDDALSLGLRESAADRLAEVGGDRHEALWRSILLREGEVFAARALLCQIWLRKATKDDLSRALSVSSAPTARGGEADKQNRHHAMLAVLLAAHGVVTEDIARESLGRLTPESRTDLLTQLAPIAPNAQRLIPAPRVVEMLKSFREVTEEEDEVSSEGKVELTDTQEVAALQIASLKMGFGIYSESTIIEIFRRAKVGESAPELLEFPELIPLASHYAETRIQERVKQLTSDPQSLAEAVENLAKHPEPMPVFEEERWFWQDKVKGEGLGEREKVLSFKC